MKKDLFELLACPNCAEATLDLKIFEQEENEISSGKLWCTGCGESYPIQDGIPRMIPRSKGGSVENKKDPKENLNRKHYEVREANIIYYDSVAEVYEEDVRITAIMSDFNQSRIDKMVKSLAQKTHQDLFLDLGCGTGNVSKFGKKYFKRAIGIDVSFNMLKLAKQNGLEVVQGDILFLPFKLSLFDVVSLFSVLHHIYDYPLVFNQISKVLKIGGYLYSDWDPTKKPSPDGEKVSWWIYQLAHILFSSARRVEERLKFIAKKDGLQNAPLDFLKMRPDLKEINVKAEFHEQKKGAERGIDFLSVKNQLELQGFSDIQPFYHQSGLTIDQLRGVLFFKSKLLTFLGFDPEPFLENILILAKKKDSREKEVSISLQQCEK